MHNALKWLLDLQTIPLEDGARLGVQFLNPFAGWLWLLIGVVSVIYVVLVYRREDTRSWRGRWTMALCRITTILLATTLLSQPALVYRQDRTEPATVAIMVDDSASMAQFDHYEPATWPEIARLAGHTADDVRRSARWPIATGLLDPQRAPLLAPLLDTHRVRLFRFAGSAARGHVVDAVDDARRIAHEWAATTPTALSTHIAPALEQVFSDCADAHLAGIVLITDGQPTRPQSWDGVAALSQARGAPVFVVLTGDPVPPLDLALTDARLASHVYLGDHTACRCRVRASGLRESTVAEVRLRPRDGGPPLATTTIELPPDGPDSHEVELTFDPQDAGTLHLVLEVDPLTGEQDTTNNRRTVDVTVVEDRARVLYVEGYARYDYRYLKNTLIREQSVTLSTLLLSADDAFVQDGDVRIRRFPTSADELDQYDVVLLGDVDPRGSWITTRQLQLLADFVNRRGGGLGLLAGERHMPQRLYGSPLEALVPVELSGRIEEQLVPLTTTAFRPRVTTAGADSAILRLLIDQEAPSELVERLPHWFWTSPVRAPRAGAEVLLEHPTLMHHDHHLPIVVVRRHGAGTVLFHGSDDTWRWRRHRGEAFVDTFWLQCIRHLARNKKFPAPRGVHLRSDRQTFDPQEPINLVLTFDEPEAALGVPDEVTVDLAADDGSAPVALRLQRTAPGSAHFQATIVPERLGRLTARFDPTRYALDLPVAETALEVVSQVEEHRRPEANHAAMVALSSDTGGRVVTPAAAATLLEDLPDKRIVVPDDVVESIWDTKLMLILFAVLLAIEWILRKRHGLA